MNTRPGSIYIIGFDEIALKGEKLLHYADDLYASDLQKCFTLARKSADGTYDALIKMFHAGYYIGSKRSINNSKIKIANKEKKALRSMEQISNK